MGRGQKTILQNCKLIWILDLTRYLDIFIYDISTVLQVYKAVVSWVAHEPRSRASILPALLQHVHFPLMSMDEVEQSSRSHLVKKNRNLATALEEARTYLAKVILIHNP